MSKPHVEYVEVDGINLRVATQRGRADPPLLLFNGIGANLELCFPFMEAMPEREIIIFDVPGVGGSPTPRSPYRPAGIARIAEGLLDHVGISGVDVLGVSRGGAIAQQFALRNPVRCRKLVLAATSPGALMVPGRPSVLFRMATPRRYVDPAHARRVASRVTFTAATSGATAPWSRARCATSASAAGVDTIFSSRRRSGGPACRGFGSCASRR